MTEREKLIGEIKQIIYNYGGIGFYGDIADFILADRRRICESILRYKSMILKVLGTSSWDEKDAPYGAMDETLKLAGLDKD